MTALRRVSVIVPTKDRPHLLAEALASIRALEGEDVCLEILVCDNGTTPETAHVAGRYGAVYLKAERPGAGAARNAGLWAASGEYIAFLDDDDVWLPTHLRPHLAMLGQHPELDGVIAQTVSADHELNPLGDPWPACPPGEGNGLLKKMLSGYFPQIGTLVARGDIRWRIGDFDETLIGGQDLDFMLRMAGAHRLGFVSTPSVLFRGRNGAAYYALQRRRVRYDRRVFLRHGVKHWRIWRSPIDFLRGYAGTVRHFYDYFMWEAHNRATSGRRMAALNAMIDAFGVLPAHAAVHLVKKRQLRAVLVQTLKSKREKSSTKPENAANKAAS